MRSTLVPASELGLQCWMQFMEGGYRCSRVMRCKYPEKMKCLAVDAELDHLHREREKATERFHTKITKLLAERAK